MFDESYIEACRKAAEEGWLKRELHIGDLCFWKGNVEVVESITLVIMRMDEEKPIFLPSQRQLQERLDEEGYTYQALYIAPDRCQAQDCPNDDPTKVVFGLGSSPEHALLKALEQVVKGKGGMNGNW